MRVIHHLDQAGRVLKIEFEPATNVGARRTAVVQTHELIRCANELIVAVRRWSEQSNYVGAERLAYASAFREMMQSRELIGLRDAVSDLRPYLAVMAAAYRQGTLFPETETDRHRRVV